MDERKKKRQRMDEPVESNNTPVDLNIPKQQYEIKFYNFTITPTSLIKINERTIIEYTIVYEDKDDKSKYLKIERVPYYFSDGETNGLKSSFRFPMLYFTSNEKNSNKGEKSNNKDFSNIGGVIKNSLVYNLETDAFSNILYEKVEKQIPNINSSGILNGKKYINHTNYKDNLNGLISIFYRVRNILDLLILVSDIKLININAQFTIDYFQNNKYMEYLPKFDKFFRKQFEVNDNTILFDDVWRFMILLEFKKIYDNFSSINTTDSLKLTPKDLTITKYNNYNEYNKSLDLFKEDNNLDNNLDDYSTINDNVKTKYNNYNELSNRLYKYIFDVSKTKTIGSIRLREPMNLDLVPFLQENWQMNVKNKYLKYKMKYYLLKNIKDKHL